MSPVSPEKQEELVLVEDHGDWAVLTINRPDKRNAMNRAAQQRFREALVEVRQKRVVVLTGNGPAFCSGIDLREAADPELDGSRSSSELPSWDQCNEDIRRHPAVFIAAVNGFALGGGSTLIHNCELAIAAESATIGTPEVGFGEWPVLSGPSLIDRVLPKHAAQLIFLAERVDAATAHRMGIVNEVVPDADLLRRAHEMAERIAGFDAVTLDWSKKAFRQMISMSWEESMTLTHHIASVASANAARS